MGRLSFFRKRLLVVSLALGALLVTALMAGHIQQHFFRARVELLLSELSSFELRKTGWSVAEAQLRHWGENRKFDDGCNEHACSLMIRLDDFAYSYVSERNIFIKLDDYFRWRLKLSYSTGPFERALWSLFRAYMLAGGHPAEVQAEISMRDGVVWGKGITVRIETYAKGGAWRAADGSRVEYTLIASGRSVPRFDFLGDRENERQLAVHPEYEIGRPDGCEICVAVWGKFTAYAPPEDMDRLMRVNTSCLTRWHPCLNENDIMPVAWSQHVAERPRVSGTPGGSSCPSPIYKIVGRDSVHIAVAEILEYHEGSAKVRILDKLKGVANWKVGEIRDVPITGGIGERHVQLRPHSRVVLIAGFGPLREMRVDPGHNCPVLFADEANLAQIREGIALDYTASEKGEQ
jgi:hypothetical protein